MNILEEDKKTKPRQIKIHNKYILNIEQNIWNFRAES